MKNSLVDLNNHLFEQLERLNDDDLSDEQLKKEIDRSKSMTEVASKIIDNAKIVLDAHKITIEYGRKEVNLPTMLGTKED